MKEIIRAKYICNLINFKLTISIYHYQYIKQIIHKMNKIILITLIIYASYSSIVNTTSFFESKIGYKLRFQSFSGYQDIDWYYPTGSASVYYSLFQSEGISLTDDTVPVIIWLQGGPGQGSQFGCFNQIGPLYIQGDSNFTVMQNGWKWSNFGHLACVDQPIGSGFSYNKNKIVSNTYQSTRHFINFIYNFVNQWNFQKNPIYLAGSGYAGHFLPVFARYLSTNLTLNLNLKGIMLGDGYVDSINQINFYDSYLYSAGIVSNFARDTTTFIQNQALLNMINLNYSRGADYLNWIVGNAEVINKFYGGVNLYNYKSYDANQKVNPNFYVFLNQNKKQFGVPDDVNYTPNNQQIYKAFNQDIGQTYADQLQYIINKGLKVLIYNGQNDAVVNTAGVLNYLNTLNWNGLRAWQKTQKQQWFSAGKNLGWVKKYRNFVFVLIKNAGHLVPVDQPRAAYNMISNFINGVW